MSPPLKCPFYWRNSLWILLQLWNGRTPQFLIVLFSSHCGRSQFLSSFGKIIQASGHNSGLKENQKTSKANTVWDHLFAVYAAGRPSWKEKVKVGRRYLYIWMRKELIRVLPALLKGGIILCMVQLLGLLSLWFSFSSSYKFYLPCSFLKGILYVFPKLQGWGLETEWLFCEKCSSTGNCLILYRLPGWVHSAVKCLLSFTDIITPGLPDVLAEEYNMPGWATASLEGYLEQYFELILGNQNWGPGIHQLQVYHPAVYASCNAGSSLPVQKEYFTGFKEAIVLSLHTESSRALLVSQLVFHQGSWERTGILCVC